MVYMVKNFLTKYLTGIKVKRSSFHDYYTNEKILRMIERKFGSQTLDHVVEMIKFPIFLMKKAN